MKKPAKPVKTYSCTGKNAVYYARLGYQYALAGKFLPFESDNGIWQRRAMLKGFHFGLERLKECAQVYKLTMHQLTVVMGDIAQSNNIIEVIKKNSLPVHFSLYYRNLKNYLMLAIPL